jgi:hypothetical protein
MKKHFGFNYVKTGLGKIKLYADENINDGLVSYLKRHYQANIISAIELGHAGQSDDFQFKQAYKLKRFLLTCDRDFLDHKLFPFNQMVGVILLDIPNVEFGIGFVGRILINEIIPSGKEMEGTKIVIHKSSIDIHYVSELGYFAVENYSFK